MSDRFDIEALAHAIKTAEVIEVHSGDREPGRRLTKQGKNWVIDGLRLLAAHTSSQRDEP